MAEKTPARKIAEDMEFERAYPMTSKLGKEKEGIRTNLGFPIAATVDAITGPKGRSEEEMSELTREVARTNKMAKGGKVRSSASKRADGIAQRGHTKGRYL